MTEIRSGLGAIASVESNPNPTLQAIAEACPDPGWQVTESVPFSSARKWSAATFADHGSWVLGAPEMLLPDGDPVRATAEAKAGDGARVLAVGRIAAPADPDQPISGFACAALVVIDQRLRPDAAETVQYFLDQDVTIKVISGDNATTVGAIAAQAGVPGRTARSMPGTCPRRRQPWQPSWPSPRCSAGSPQRRSRRWWTLCTRTARRWR
jgi:cation-transporting ATPase E